ncbi:(2Fe-2S) ferredoxin domain-containing protein [Sessilibacter sp. MAH4]
MPRPEKHVFICAQTRAEGHPRGSCGQTGAVDVFQSFANEINQRQLMGKVALTSTGCLGPCQVGVNVLVYPEGVMYCQITPDIVPKIVEQHLMNGDPVTEKIAPAEIW